MSESRKILLSDGGSLYNPERPRVAHPATRAAARFLLAIERLTPEVVRSLRSEVLPLYRQREVVRGWELVEDGSEPLFLPSRPDPILRRVERTEDGRRVVILALPNKLHALRHRLERTEDGRRVLVLSLSDDAAPIHRLELGEDEYQVRRVLLSDRSYSILPRVKLTKDGPRTVSPVYHNLMSLPERAERITAEMVTMVEVSPRDSDQMKQVNPWFPEEPVQLGHWGFRVEFTDPGETRWVPATDAGVAFLESQGWVVGRRRRPTGAERRRIDSLLERLQEAADRDYRFDRLLLARSCAPALCEWAKRYHLLSRHITRLVVQVLHGWKHREELPAEDGKWGKRVEFFADSRKMRRYLEAVRAWTDAKESGDAEALNECNERLEDFPREISFWGGFTPPLDLHLPGWDAGFEEWSEAVARLRRAFEEELDRHRRREEGRTVGWERAPVKIDDRHFEWLVWRQVRGRRPWRQAELARVSASAVHAALDEVAGLLELELRTVKPGPAEVLEED